MHNLRIALIAIAVLLEKLMPRRDRPHMAPGVALLVLSAAVATTSL